MLTAPAYNGVDNLEVMEVAERYCRYLTSTVTSVTTSGAAPNIVDFGAGTGTIARRLASEGYRVRCVELDSTLAARLRDDGFETAPSLDTFTASAPADVVYSMNVLEHIEDDTLALSNVFGAIRPGGSLVLYVPAMPILFSAMDKKVGHLRRYKRRQLSDLATRVGFEVQRTEYVDSLGFFATLAYKMIGSKDGDISTRSVAFYDRFGFPVSRALDRVTCRLFGKNLVLYACRPMAG
jgi:SAM-dependent methyltransferase